MPVFMDRHFAEDATRQTMELAHTMDLEVQSKYGVRFLTYWFDEERCSAFCLVHAPDKGTIRQLHDEAHGNVPHEIIEVDPSAVELFLGRIADPAPSPEQRGTARVDSAFRTIMFTDLKDSTEMATRLGDRRAMHLLRVHNALVRGALRDYNGREVKHTGDGFMVSFVRADDAVQCAIAIQDAFADYNRTHADESLYVRIGLSCGEPVEEDNDLFGTTVQLAARICASAAPGEVLVAASLRELCLNSELHFSDRTPAVLKGFADPVPVVAVVLKNQ